VSASKNTVGAGSSARALARLARQLEKALEPLELTLPQFRVLSLLADGSSASSALASRLAVSPPSMTAVIDGLSARGLVDRLSDPDDRRRLTLLLTPAGKKTLRAAEAAVGARLVEVGRFLEDPARATEALATLAEWNHALDRFREEKRVAEKR
jgi:long-chain acyl-CoA synthetase